VMLMEALDVSNQSSNSLFAPRECVGGFEDCTYV
jgi:hypothetical protein